MLKEQGVVTRGQIIDCSFFKGGINIRYEFTINGKRYVNSSNYKNMYTGNMADKIGHKFPVIYQKSNPTTIKS